MKRVLLIYGSSGGNTELVCYKVAEVLKENNLTSHLKRVEQSHPGDILDSDLCVLAAPTYEHGIIQYHFLPFLRELKLLDLHQHPMAVIGLGDPSYDMHYHIESANTLVEAIKASQGNLLHHPLRISGLPFPHFEGRIRKWSQELAEKTKSLRSDQTDQ